MHCFCANTGCHGCWRCTDAEGNGVCLFTCGCQVKPVECIVNAGEMIFVPRGWWHMAINLETSIAITQNFVSRTTLPHVLAFLQPGRSDLVSGCSKEERWVEREPDQDCWVTARHTHWAASGRQVYVC